MKWLYYGTILYISFVNPHIKYNNLIYKVGVNFCHLTANVSASIQEMCVEDTANRKICRLPEDANNSDTLTLLTM